MPDHPSPTPEGRRCPECGGLLSAMVRRVRDHSQPCAAPPGLCCINDECGRFLEPVRTVPTPSPEGGVPETRLCNQPAGDEELCQLPAGHEGRCAHPDYPPGWRSDNEHDDPATPTSAEGGEANPNRCPECGGWKPGPRLVAHSSNGARRCGNSFHSHEDAPASPTPASTGEEDAQPCNRCGVRGESSVKLNGGYCNDCAVVPAGVRARLQELLKSESELRRQLAEAEEENAALKNARTGGYWWSQAIVARERATTAERRLEEKEAHVKLADQRGRAEWELRVKAEGEASAFKAEATALQQEVARLRKLASRVAGHIVHTSACPYHLRGECYCGLDELRRELAALSTPKQGKPE